MNEDERFLVGLFAVFVIACLITISLSSMSELSYIDGYKQGYQDGYGNGTEQMSAVMTFGCASAMSMLDCEEGLQELQENEWFQDSFNQLVWVFGNG